MNFGEEQGGGDNPVVQELARPQTPPTVYVTRTQFLSHDTAKIRYKDVSIEGLGTVRIKSLTDREHSRLQAATMKSDGKVNITAAMASDAALIAECTLNGDNTAMFSESDVKDIRDRDAGITTTLAAAIRDHIGLPDAGSEKK
jgi:hypothetical protein